MPQFVFCGTSDEIVDWSPGQRSGRLTSAQRLTFTTAGLDVFVQYDVDCLLTDLTLLSIDWQSQGAGLLGKARLKGKIRMVHPSDRSHHAIFIQRRRM
jgi:hypothetical protein